MLKFQKSPKTLPTDILEFIKTGDNFKLILLSGGSLVEELEEVFSTLIKDGSDLTKVTISLVDERFGEYELHEDSNFKQIMDVAGIEKLKSMGVKFRPILNKGLDIHSARSHFNAYLETVFSSSDFDTLAILGLGKDYHTAGILPHKVHQSFMFYETNAVAYFVDEVSTSTDTHRERITITFSAISKLDHVWVYAVGENKKQVVKDFWDELDNPDVSSVHEKPAHALAVLPELTLYTD